MQDFSPLFNFSCRTVPISFTFSSLFSFFAISPFHSKHFCSYFTTLQSQQYPFFSLHIAHFFSISLVVIVPNLPLATCCLNVSKAEIGLGSVHVTSGDQYIPEQMKEGVVVLVKN